MGSAVFSGEWSSRRLSREVRCAKAEDDKAVAPVNASSERAPEGVRLCMMLCEACGGDDDVGEFGEAAAENGV